MATKTAPKAQQLDKEIVANLLSTRSELLKKFMDTRRDIYAECGYEKSLKASMYKDLYIRDPIAARVVELMAKESWGQDPDFYENEEADTITELEAAFDDMCNDLRGEHNWYNEPEGSLFWEALYRADILSGIGQFGVLLLGFDDGKELSEPIEFINKVDRDKQASDNEDDVEATTNALDDAEEEDVTDDEEDPMDDTEEQVKKPAKKYEPKTRLLYMRPFDEDLVDIVQYETDKRSPRCGQPVMYSIQFNDYKENESQTGIGLDMRTLNVHWSRVIHIPSDSLGSSDVLAAPRLRVVWNRIYDLVKLYSGSAEMYWKGAFPGISIETHPQLGGDVAVDMAAIRQSMEQYMNGLQRYFSLMGMSAKTLSPQVVDPTPQIKTQLEAICIHLECPLRIFTGSERGELASSQDDSSWTDRVARNQRKRITPRIIVPTINRLIAVGCLPPPEETFRIEWPDLSVVSDAEKAAVALQVTQAVVAFVSGNVEAAMTLKDFFVRILKWTEEEADAVIKAAEEQAPEDRFSPDPEKARQEQMEQDGELKKQQFEIMKNKPGAALAMQQGPPGAAGKPVGTGGGNNRPPFAKKGV